MMKANGLGIFVYLFLIFYTVQSSPCTVDDYIGSYTECLGGYKHLIYYKKPDSTCTGFDNMPENKFNIPCCMYSNVINFFQFQLINEFEFRSPLFTWRISSTRCSK